eukprot:236247-Chlamydomonas_euryale.AAC.1
MDGRRGAGTLRAEHTVSSHPPPSPASPAGLRPTIGSPGTAPPPLRAVLPRPVWAPPLGIQGQPPLSEPYFPGQSGPHHWVSKDPPLLSERYFPGRRGTHHLLSNRGQRPEVWRQSVVPLPWVFALAVAFPGPSLATLSVAGHCPTIASPVAGSAIRFGDEAAMRPVAAPACSQRARMRPSADARATAGSLEV